MIYRNERRYCPNCDETTDHLLVGPVYRDPKKVVAPYICLKCRMYNPKTMEVKREETDPPPPTFSEGA